MAFHSPAKMIRRLVRKRCEIQAWYDGGDRAQTQGKVQGLIDPLSGAGRIVGRIEPRAHISCPHRAEGRTERLLPHGQPTQRVGLEPGTAESLDCRRAAGMHRTATGVGSAQS